MADIRKTEQRSGPKTGAGGGAAYRTGYGAGGLGSGEDRADPDEAVRETATWDAPGVTPDGHRTGSSTDGPRTAMDGESEPEAGDDEAAD
ncbi:hypothetical protein [Phenylobacterium soli]|uniref:Uncharacterized protein n=1 Tax=Phenylobacterium soli TaxID=2170551 RepID=A0A328AIE9_9CAUL|nr:hypothetical protein [Phenylobacterium soli]RAK53836.1 hypothetical protein DJ017_04495 [Phenylobacterium soli]